MFALTGVQLSKNSNPPHFVPRILGRMAHYLSGHLRPAMKSVLRCNIALIGGVLIMVVAMPTREIERPSEPSAAPSLEAMAAFDYTCRHYLKISGTEFLRRFDHGEIRPDPSNVRLSRVLAMLPFVR
jgi:hypothetical protein